MKSMYLKNKDKQINLRLDDKLYAFIKAKSASMGMTYSRYIRALLEYDMYRGVEREHK